MDKQKYLNILNTDINRFISYLIDDNLDGLDDADKVNLYITDSFPYLSILHLIHSNFDSKEVDNFIINHESVLVEETKQLRLLLGYFLCDNKELEALKLQLNLFKKEKEEKATEIHLLKEELTKTKIEKETLEKDIKILKDENGTLVRKIADLKNKSKESASEPSLGSHSNEVTNGNVSGDIPSDLIDMGTSVLWRSSNLGAEKGFEEGDYFSWRALSCAEYFGSDVWGYKQVIKKNISGLEEFDVVQSILGEGYRIPTVKEWKELMEICEHKLRVITIKGRKYVKLISAKTNNQLLLPIIGHVESEVCYDEFAQYWTSEQYSGKSSYICQIHETGWALTYAPKWWGLPIRPVFDKSNKPLVLDDIDRTRLQAIDTIQRVQITAQQSIASLFGSKTTAKIPSKKYPAKSEINESTIFNLLIKDCLPYGKFVFEGDIIWEINLDLKKLNKILEEGYSIKPLNYENIRNIRLKDLKALILMKLS